MSEIVITLVLLGSTITLLGYFFPQLDVVLPDALNRFWGGLRYDAFVEIAPESVDRFIRWTEQLANLTATGAKSLPISVPIVVFSIWPVLSLAGISPVDLINGISDQSSVDLGGYGILISTGFVIVSIMVIKSMQGVIQELLSISATNRRFWQLDRELRLIKKRIKSLQSDLEEARKEDDTSKRDDDFIRWLEDQLDEMERHQRRVERRKDETASLRESYRNAGKSESRHEYKSLGSIFWIFIVSAAALGIYGWQIIALIGDRISQALFASAPSEGAMTALYLLFPTVVIFILAQSFVPSLMTLSDPRRLITGVRRGNNDPLGQASVFIFLFGVSLSLVMTFGAFLIGNYYEPEAYVPQTLQMVFSNAIFDGLTFALTLMIMRQLGKPWFWFRRWRAFLALIGFVIVDLFIASILSMASLFFGMLGTPEALTIEQVANVLIGLNTAGTEYSAGPFFWVMHTAFFPTLGYLAVISFWSLAKLIFTVMGLFAKRAASRGLMSTGGMILAVAGIYEAILALTPTI